MSIIEIQDLCNNKIVFESCTGSLKSQNKEYQIKKAKIYLSDNNDVIMEGCSDNIFISQDEDKVFSGIFTDNQNRIISFDKLYIYKTPISNDSFIEFEAIILNATIKNGIIDKEALAQIYVILTTIEFCGNEFIEIDGKRDRALNKFTLPPSIELSLINYKFQGISNSTGFIKLTTTINKWETEWPEIIKRLYYILSFSASNFVSMPLTYFIYDDGSKKIEMHSSSQETGRGSSIFYLKHPGVMYNVINTIYPNYFKHEQALDLNKLFHYYIMMKNTHYLENAYLLGCVFMEGVKHSYAKKYKNYPENKGGYFLKAPNRIYTFKELIKEVYNEFRLRDGDEEFIKYRNEVIHQGSIDLPFPEMERQKEQLEITIEKLLLNILGFKGEYYWDRESNDWIKYQP
ncbi:MAG: hypothetical protein KBG25_07885 [Paludibacteraceae bacterium]|nr:hypothetical protein [Paludibacteraceae bacterium]